MGGMEAKSLTLMLKGWWGGDHIFDSRRASVRGRQDKLAILHVLKARTKAGLTLLFECNVKHCLAR